MIVSSYQPYFAPFPGFFEKILSSEVFVIMDSVQFPLGRSWLTRNRFKNDKGIYWIRVPVWRKGKGLQNISEVRICYDRGWAERTIKGLRMAYKNAPYFSEHIGFWEKILSMGIERLVDLNLKIIHYVMDYLNIRIRPVLLSELGIKKKEPELTICICKSLGAKHFLARKSAKKYLDLREFKKEGIEVIFFNPKTPVYPQLWGDFIPNLSIFDLIFNCGPKTLDIMKG